MKILCDLDDTVINLIDPWLAAYNRDYDDYVTPEDFTDWDMTKFVKAECGAKIFDYLKTPDIYRGAPAIPGALEALKKLEAEHQVDFLSSGFNVGKLDWMIDHGALPAVRFQAEFRLFIVHDKSRITGDLLIDDGAHNVTAVKMPAILFDQPHNRSLKWFPRAHNWEEVLDLTQNIDCWKDKCGLIE